MRDSKRVQNKKSEGTWSSWQGGSTVNPEAREKQRWGSVVGAWCLVASYFLPFELVWAVAGPTSSRKIAVLVALCGIFYDRLRGLRVSVDWRILGLMIALAIWVFLGSFTAFSPPRARLVSLEMVKLAVVYSLMRNAMTSEWGLRQVLGGMVFLGCLLAVNGLGLYLIGSRDGVLFPMNVGRFALPNQRAFVLATLVAVALGLGLSARTASRRWLWQIGGALLFAGVVASQSKAAFFGAVPALLLYVGRNWWKSVGAIGFVLAIFLILTAVAQKNSSALVQFKPMYLTSQGFVVDQEQPAVRHRLALLFDFKERCYSGRAVTWKLGLQLFVSSPVFGVGGGCFPRAYQALARRRGEPPDMARMLPAHNTAIQVAAELGGVGLGIFLLLWPGALVRLWYSGKIKGPAEALGKGIRLSFVGALLMAGVQDNFWEWQVYLLLAAVGGLLALELETASRRTAGSPSADVAGHQAV